jgi:hypothetical protein
MGITALSEVSKVESVEQATESSLFSEEWAARHNQEIWGTPPGGTYEALPPPCRTQAMR